eukprot:364516-Chlamydomonas_euryale.AAC.3
MAAGSAPSPSRQAASARARRRYNSGSKTAGTWPSCGTHRTWGHARRHVSQTQTPDGGTRVRARHCRRGFHTRCEGLKTRPRCRAHTLRGPKNQAQLQSARAVRA